MQIIDKAKLNSIRAVNYANAIANRAAPELLDYIKTEGVRVSLNNECLYKRDKQALTLLLENAIEEVENDYPELVIHYTTIRGTRYDVMLTISIRHPNGDFTGYKEVVIPLARIDSEGKVCGLYDYDARAMISPEEYSAARQKVLELDAEIEALKKERDTVFFSIKKIGI